MKPDHEHPIDLVEGEEGYVYWCETCKRSLAPIIPPTTCADTSPVIVECHVCRNKFPYAETYGFGYGINTTRYCHACWNTLPFDGELEGTFSSNK